MVIVPNATGNSSSLLTLCIIHVETRSQEHVNLDQNLFPWLSQHQCQFTASVGKKEIEKGKNVKRQLLSATNFISIIYILNFNWFVCSLSMHVPEVIADCDDVSTEHLLKHIYHGRV